MNIDNLLRDLVSYLKKNITDQIEILRGGIIK